MNKLIFSYISDGADWHFNTENFKNIDVVNYCFATLKDTKGTLNTNFKQLDKLKSLREINPDIKFVLSIGGWGAGNFSEVAEDESAREFFVKQVIDFLVDNDFNGVDMDWEYPTDGSSGISYHPNDKENFTKLSELLRSEMDKVIENALLTVAIGAYPGAMKSFEAKTLNNLYNYVHIMNYDYIGMDRVTCHHSNLFPSSLTKHKNSASDYFEYFISEGLLKEKIIFGVPFYVRGLTKTENKPNGLSVRAYGETPIFHDYDYLETKNKEFFFYDEEACAPYYYDGEEFLTFDDERSLNEKIKFVNENELNGMMFWEYPTDKTSKLITVLSKGLK